MAAAGIHSSIPQEKTAFDKTRTRSVRLSTFYGTVLFGVAAGAQILFTNLEKAYPGDHALLTSLQGSVPKGEEGDRMDHVRSKEQAFYSRGLTGNVIYQ